MEGNLDEVKKLVGTYIADHGKDNLPTYINSLDAGGNAAIHGAVFSGHLDILTFLVESCEASLTTKNGLGCSPLWIAAGYDQINCLEYLIEKLHESNELNSALLKDGANTTGDTPFLAAVSKGNLKACTALLQAANKLGENTDEALQQLFKARILRTANKSGDTPLKVAVATSQNKEMITFLLRVDNEVGELTNQRTTLDEDAAIQKPSLNRANNAGLYPLIIACERNLPTIADHLLKHDADITVLDSKGRNPLAIAAFCGCNDTVELLLSQSSQATYGTYAYLDQKDNEGSTPLWLAARTGNLSIVELLMDAGADATIADKEGLTPQEVAVKYKKEKVMEYFSKDAK